MVEPTWLLMSSPMIGNAGVEEALRPLGVRGDEDRDGVDEGHPGLEARLGVVALGLLGADRQIGDEHVGTGARVSASATSTGGAGDSSTTSR